MTTHDSDFRLGELILFISQKSAEDAYYGAVKLNKLLFYADAFAYAQWGESITGAEYWNQREGPVPKRLVQVRDRLIADKSLAIQYIQTGLPNPQQKPIALRAPKLESFSGDRLLLVEDVIHESRNLNGTDLSNRSHKEWGWKLTSQYDLIDLRTILLSTAKLSDAEEKRALELLVGDEDIQRELQQLRA